MYRLKKYFFVFCLMLGVPEVYTAEEPIGTLNFMVGEVSVKPQNYVTWKNIKLYAHIRNHDQIKTGEESRCEVKLTNGSVVRIGENSSFNFTQKPQHKGSTFFNSLLNWGRIWVNVPLQKDGDRFHINSPTAVCAVRGTIYAVDVDSTTRISVYDGAVDVGPASLPNSRKTPPPSKSLQPSEVSGPQQVQGPHEVTLDEWIQIVAGFQVEIFANGKYTKTKIETDPNQDSDWKRWNLNRDKLIDRQD